MSRVYVTLTVAIGSVLAGYAAGAEHAKPTLRIAAKPSPFSAPSSPPWETIARSVEGRPIEMLSIGHDSRNKVLVVGPLHGDEPSALAMIDRLARNLSRFPDRIQNAAVTIVRLPNPDGYVHGRATNAHRVDLDRNFASSDWRKVPFHGHWLSGRLPQSEPETDALVNLIDDLMPQRIILIGSATNRASVRFAGPAEELASQVASASGARLDASQESDGSGSLATYAGTDRGIATLIVNVPQTASAGDNWARFSKSLLIAIRSAGPRRAVDRPATPSEDTDEQIDAKPSEGSGERSNLTPSEGSGERSDQSALPQPPSDAKQADPAPSVPDATSGAASGAANRAKRFWNLLTAIGLGRDSQQRRLASTSAAPIAAAAGTAVQQHPTASTTAVRGDRQVSNPAAWKQDEPPLVPVISPRARRRMAESKKLLKQAAGSEADRATAEVEPAAEERLPLVQRAARSTGSAVSAEANEPPTRDPRVRRLPPVETWRKSTAERPQQEHESVRWPQPPIPLFAEPRDRTD